VLADTLGEKHFFGNESDHVALLEGLNRRSDGKQQLCHCQGTGASRPAYNT
jgi:hypothetical protein